jgi:2-phosphoglycerate kinase
MVYLIGGAPRAGKTTTAKQFAADTGVGYLSLDYLKMGLYRGVPELGVVIDDDLKTASQLRPIVEGMVRTFVENKEDYLIEGLYALPEYASALREELGHEVRSCFIGYAEIDTAEKIQLMRKYVREEDYDWMSEDDEEAARNVEYLKSFSTMIQDECAKYELKYFESRDYGETVKDVVRYLTEPS